MYGVMPHIRFLLIITEVFIIYTKLDATPMELFIRGVLCNFLVCLAVYTGMKLKSESGKMIMMFCIITAFVLAGFEHCVANMGTMYNRVYASW